MICALQVGPQHREKQLDINENSILRIFLNIQLLPRILSSLG